MTDEWLWVGLVLFLVVVLYFFLWRIIVNTGVVKRYVELQITENRIEKHLHGISHIVTETGEQQRANGLVLRKINEHLERISNNAPSR
jgi:hypothetical protein